MATHTPGPWNMGPRIAKYRALPANGTEGALLGIANAIEFEALSIGTRTGQVAIIPLDESSRENAGLILTAPDLLRALEAAVALIEIRADDQISSDRMRETYAAYLETSPRKTIARAKGEIK